jgi:hypothetical protein
MDSLLTDLHKALSSSGLQIIFNNHGRTSAEITEECVEWRVIGTQLPDLPEYIKDNTRPADLGTVVDSGKDHQLKAGTVGLLAGRRGGGGIISEEIDAIETSSATLWVYGFIRFRDFLGISHAVGFCTYLEMLRDPESGKVLALRFVEGGPASYKYRK